MMARLLLLATVLLLSRSAIIVLQCSTTSATYVYYIQPVDILFRCKVLFSTRSSDWSAVFVSYSLTTPEKQSTTQVPAWFLLLGCYVNLENLSNVTLTAYDGEQYTSVVLVNSFFFNNYGQITCTSCGNVVFSGLELQIQLLQF